jgi:hypothetical protein
VPPWHVAGQQQKRENVVSKQLAVKIADLTIYVLFYEQVCECKRLCYPQFFFKDFAFTSREI